MWNSESKEKKGWENQFFISTLGKCVSKLYVLSELWDCCSILSNPARIPGKLLY